MTNNNIISFDESPFDSVARIGQIDKNGFLRVKIRAAKIGVLPYLAREFPELEGVEDFPAECRVLILRDEAALFDRDSMESLAGMPLLLAHNQLQPGTTGLVEGLDGTAPLVVGSVSGEVMRDGQYLTCQGVVTHKPTIEAIQGRDLIEISPSFKRKFRLESGTWNGREYDGVIYDIRYNHLALLPEGSGRAGGDIAIQEDQKTLSDRSEKIMSDKNNVEVRTKYGNVLTDDSGSEVVSKLNTTSDQLEESLKKVEALEAEIAAIRAEMESKISALAAERDTALGELKAFKEKVESFDRPEVMAGMVQEAVAVQEQAKNMNSFDELPPELRKLPIPDLKKAAIIKYYETQGVTSDSKDVKWDNPEYVAGLWRGLKVTSATNKKTVPVAGAFTQDSTNKAPELSDLQKLSYIKK